MASDFAKAFGLAHKLFIASDVVGITQADWNMAAENPVLLRKIGAVLRRYAEITLATHVIDCDAYPFVPNGWRVEEHQKGGKFKGDPTKVEFYRNLSQMNSKYTEGNLLRKELSKKPVLNANVLDYLLANQELIPEAWKAKTNGNTTYIFFWGTIYRDSVANLCVRCLFWNWSVGQWGSGYDLLSNDFWYDSPAVLRAS